MLAFQDEKPALIQGIKTLLDEVAAFIQELHLIIRIATHLYLPPVYGESSFIVEAAVVVELIRRYFAQIPVIVVHHFGPEPFRIFLFQKTGDVFREIIRIHMAEDDDENMDVVAGNLYADTLARSVLKAFEESKKLKDHKPSS